MNLNTDILDKKQHLLRMFDALLLTLRTNNETRHSCNYWHRLSKTLQERLLGIWDEWRNFYLTLSICCKIRWCICWNKPHLQESISTFSKLQRKTKLETKRRNIKCLPLITEDTKCCMAGKHLSQIQKQYSRRVLNTYTESQKMLCVMGKV